MFEDHDGSVVRHEDLSYGQKRLLAFYYYLAASPVTVIADELVDGLHHLWIDAAIEAGAVGYLLKDAEPEVLLDGIRAVARGGSPLDPRAARRLLSSRSTAAAESGDVEVSALSPREAEVLRLVVEGLLNKQIAQRLGITERTVKAHLTSIFATIGVGDRTSAALWAERHRV